jgi:hypothetical protein
MGNHGQGQAMSPASKNSSVQLAASRIPQVRTCTKSAARQVGASDSEGGTEPLIRWRAANCDH